MKMHAAILLYFLLILETRPAAAGAWLRAPREIYAKAAVLHQSADKQYSAKGKTIDMPDFRDDSFSLYGELGLNDRWTAIASMEAKSLTMQGPAGERTTSGPDDAWLLAKRGWLTQPLVLSTQFGVKLPMGYDREENPPLGQGQVDYEARLLAGKSFHPAYVNVEYGFRRRNGDYSDEFPYRAEAGVSMGRRLSLQVALDGVDTRGNDAAASRPQAERAPNVFDKEYTDLTVGIGIALSNGFRLEPMFKQTIAGANTAASRGFGLGLSWQGSLGRTKE